MIKPKKLNPGDKIATVSLSWGGPSVFPHRYQVGVQQLQDEFGLQVGEMQHALADADWLARNPKARARFQQAFERGDVAKSYLAVVDGESAERKG